MYQTGLAIFLDSIYTISMVATVKQYTFFARCSSFHILLQMVCKSEIILIISSLPPGVYSLPPGVYPLAVNKHYYYYIHRGQRLIN